MTMRTHVLTTPSNTKYFFMNSIQPQELFDERLANLIAFSPEPGDKDIYLPSSQESSSSTYPLPSDFIIFSQNAHK